MIAFHSRISALRLPVLSLLGLLVAVAGLVLAGMTLAAPVVRADDSATPKEMEQLYRESKARAAIVKRIGSAVVHIAVEKTVKAGSQDTPDPFDDEYFRRFFQPRLPPNREFKQRGLGSGTIVDSKNGYILTNNHVVADSDKLSVKLPDGRQLDAKVIGVDPATDLAVIKITSNDLPQAKLGNSDELDVGESVIAIGNPFGLEQTVTLGIVSAKGRTSVGLTDYEDFIQTDASINPGNSGGPLMNLKGEVVGVNTAIYSRSGGNMGIGFSIPINQARAVMDSLIKFGKVTRGFLGVVIQDITPDIASALGVTAGEGVLVANVGPTTPAGKSGVKQSDIILTFNNKPVKSVNALRAAVASVKPGTAVPAEVLREGKKVKLSIKVEEQPADMRAAIGEGGQPPGGAKPGDAAQVLGMAMQELTPETAERLGYSGQTGVVVSDVEANSAAAQAGIQQGALILSVNRKPVKTVAEVQAAVKQAAAGQGILFLVRMGQFDRFIAIKKP
jgi:serine protease Do